MTNYGRSTMTRDEFYKKPTSRQYIARKVYSVSEDGPFRESGYHKPNTSRDRKYIQVRLGYRYKELTGCYTCPPVWTNRLGWYGDWYAADVILTRNTILEQVYLEAGFKEVKGEFPDR